MIELTHQSDVLRFKYNCYSLENYTFFNVLILFKILLLFLLLAGYKYIIPHLEKNTTYLMRAASRNLAGLSDWSAVKVFTTAAGCRWNPSLYPIYVLILAFIWT